MELVENKENEIGRKIEHMISPVWAQHITEVREQMRANEEARLRLEGQIRRLEAGASVMQRHLEVLLGLIEKSEKLPASIVPYQLSDDGRKMIGIVKVEPPPPPAPHVNGAAEGITQ